MGREPDPTLLPQGPPGLPGLKGDSGPKGEKVRGIRGPRGWDPGPLALRGCKRNKPAPSPARAWGGHPGTAGPGEGHRGPRSRGPWGRGLPPLSQEVGGEE